jgi:hypothetical protein
MDHNNDELGGTTLMATRVPSPTEKERERKERRKIKRKEREGGGFYDISNAFFLVLHTLGYKSIVSVPPKGLKPKKCQKKIESSKVNQQSPFSYKFIPNCKVQHMNLMPHNKSCAKHEQNKTILNDNNKSNQLDLVFWIQNVTHYTQRNPSTIKTLVDTNLHNFFKN